MKKIIASVKKWEDQLEARWEGLPEKKQRKIIWIALILYVLITAAVIGEAWTQGNAEGHKIDVRHIQIPVIPVGPVQPEMYNK